MRADLGFVFAEIPTALGLAASGGVVAVIADGFGLLVDAFLRKSTDTGKQQNKENEKTGSIFHKFRITADKLKYTPKPRQYKDIDA